MKPTKLSFLFSLVLGLLFAVSAFGQTHTFSDPNVEYTFILPETTWKMTAKPSTISPNVEYVYGDRAGGHLEIRKLNIKSGSMISDIIRDEETKLQFLPGYVAGKEENFAGNLKGTVFNYEFVRSGRPMSGRFYYLKANDTTIYVLRFTGMSDKLRSIRNLVDSIARTFEVKKG